MLAYRTIDGTLLWETRRADRAGVEHTYRKNSHASATPVTDGQRIYASFGTHGLAAFDFTAQAGVAPASSATSATITAARARRCSTRTASSSSRITAAADARLVRRRVQRRNGRGHLEERSVSERRLGNAHRHQRRRLATSSSSAASSACLAYDPDTGAELWTVRGNTTRGDPDAGRRSRPGVLLVGPRRPDAGDQTGGQRRRHRYARRVVVAAGITVRAVGTPARRSALHDQRHAEHPDGARREDRISRCIRTGSASRRAKASRRRRWPSATSCSSRTTRPDVRGAGRPTFKLLHVNELNAQVLASPALVDGTWYWRTDKELLAIGRK